MVDRWLGPTTRLLLPYAERFTDELVAHARRSTPVANIFDTPPCAQAEPAGRLTVLDPNASVL